MKKTLSKTSFQIIILVGTVLLFWFIQANVFSQSFGSVIGGIAISTFVALILALIVYWIVNRNSPSANPKVKFKMSWLYTLVVILLLFNFSPIQDPDRAISSSSPSSTSGKPYADNQIHHCTYCGTEFKGPGYLSPMRQCVKSEQDAGIGDIYTCSLKCCKESLQ